MTEKPFTWSHISLASKLLKYRIQICQRAWYLHLSVFVYIYVRSGAVCVAATKSVSALRARAASGLPSNCSKNPTTARPWCCGRSSPTWSGCWVTSTRLARSSPRPRRLGELKDWGAPPSVSCVCCGPSWRWRTRQVCEEEEEEKLMLLCPQLCVY